MTRNPQAMLLIIVLGVLVRAWCLNTQSYSNDEVIELEDVRALSTQEIVFAADSFPPLFRLLLAPVIRLTDWDLSGRALSLAFGTLCIPFAYLIGKRLDDCHTGVIAALLVASSPICVYYSQEVRPYALYMLTGAATLWSGMLAIEGDRAADWRTFTLCAIVGSYVHYYFCFLVVALYVAWLIRCASSRQYRNGAIAVVTMVLGCSPLVFIFDADFAFTGDHATIEVRFDFFALAYSFFSFLSGFTVGPSIAELHELVTEPKEAIRQFFPSIVITFIVVVLPLIYGVWALRKRRLIQLTLILAATVPLLLAAVFSQLLDLNYNVRYVVISVIPCLLLVAAGLAHFPNRRLAFLATLTIVAWFGNGVIRRHTLPRYHNEDVRAAADWLETENGARREIYVVSDYMARTLAYYMAEPNNVHRFPERDMVMARIESTAEMEKALDRVRGETPDGCWIAITRAYHGDPHRLFRDWLGKQPHVRWTIGFPGIELFYWDHQNEQSTDYSATSSVGKTVAASNK